jgi:ABC-type antimicrobial peptide transport system permease subunit
VGSDKYSEALNGGSLYYSAMNQYYSEGDERENRYIDYRLYPENSKYIVTVNTVAVFKPLVYGGVVILIIVLVNCLNILNVTMSNLALRRNEFAQLRAIGMTKESLYKGVILEGVIMWIAACILGIAAGIPILYLIYKNIMIYLIYSEFSVNWTAIIVAAVMSFIVLIGAYYFPMKRMKLDVAEELMRSGE